MAAGPGTRGVGSSSPRPIGISASRVGPGHCCHRSEQDAPRRVTADDQPAPRWRLSPSSRQGWDAGFTGPTVRSRGSSILRSVRRRAGAGVRAPPRPSAPTHRPALARGGFRSTEDALSASPSLSVRGKESGAPTAGALARASRRTRGRAGRPARRPPEGRAAAARRRRCAAPSRRRHPTWRCSRACS